MLKRHRKIGTKRMALILILAALSMITTGCGGDTTKKTDTDGGDRQDKQAEEPQSGLFPDVAGTVWSDAWGVKSADGEDLDVKADALVLVPKADNMSVAEVREYEFSKENKKQMAEGIFGQNVYAYDSETLPKELLQEELNEAREYLEDVESRGESEDDASYKSDLKYARQEVKYLEGLMKHAKDEFTLASEIDYEAKRFMGERNGVQYVLDFGEEGYMGRKIRFSACHEQDVYPEQLKNSKSVSYQDSEGSTDGSGFALEDAKKMAEEFLMQAGYSGSVYRQNWVLEWKGDQTQKVREGYRLSYGVGIGNVAFVDSGTEHADYADYMNVIYDKDLEGNYSMETYMDICVTQKGVISAEWNAPVKLESVTENVKLLPFSDIVKVMKGSMGNFIGKECGIHLDHVKVNRIELVYFRMKDDSKKGYYSYIPAWRASHDKSTCICIVNAMDGTVIDVVNELTVSSAGSGSSEKQ